MYSALIPVHHIPASKTKHLKEFSIFLDVNLSQIIDSKHDFKFGDMLARSRGMVELMFTKPGFSLEILILLDVVDLEIQALLGLDVLDCNNLLFDNVTNHLWKGIIVNLDPLRF